MTEHGLDLWPGLWGDFPPHDVPFLADGEAQAIESPPAATRRLALVLAYDGGPYAGWQVQPGAVTVQGELERALSQLCGRPVRVHASGRTDAGVHAWGQVVSFNAFGRLEPEAMLAGLRALLPPEIHPRALGRVAPDFHARYAARAKTYDYFLWPQAGPALFQRQRLWPLWRALDERAVRQALEPLPGPRDLKPFASQGAEAKGSTVRQIFEARLDTGPRGLWRIRLTASGFLRHVVRNLAGALVMVGLGKAHPFSILDACEAGRRSRPGPKAPAGGLYLNRVFYQCYNELPLTESPEAPAWNAKEDGI